MHSEVSKGGNGGGRRCERLDGKEAVQEGSFEDDLGHVLLSLTHRTGETVFDLN